MVFFTPLVHAILSLREYDLIQEALEHCEAFGYLLDLNEGKDAEVQEHERAERQMLRSRRKGTLP